MSVCTWGMAGVALVLSMMASIAQAAPDLKLWYDAPGRLINASAMDDTLPIGNGRLGGLIFGNTAHEEVILNEDSLWTGDANPSGNYNTMGSYQLLGKLLLDQPGHEQATDYRRELDLARGVATVSYKVGQTTFKREYFVSHADQVMVIRLTADKPAALTGSIELVDGHKAPTVVKADSLAIDGVLPNGLKYASKLIVQPEDGQLKTAGDRLTFNGCESLTLLLDAGTNYAMNAAVHYRGPGSLYSMGSHIFAASQLSYPKLLQRHEKDYKALFDRVSLDLGSSTDAQKAMPTNERKIAAAKTVDPELEATLFQFGRYLLISSSRPGSLPANLQGIWNDSNSPPWHCDYHANINIQMNYWPAETTNLAECHTPLFDLIDSQLPEWRKATHAAKEFNLADGSPTPRGLAVRTSHNIFGGMGWQWDKTANAWYCQHYWEHYAFGLDKSYLQRVAYPIMKETCEFWIDHLKTLPDGTLVVPNGWSPEHGPHEDGVSYNQEIVWDLFNNTAEAAGVLGDDAFRTKIIARRDKLATPGIGSWGQLLEWHEEKHDPKEPKLDTPNDDHRHTSHLFGVYPGRQIGLTSDPQRAKAAAVSLKARGDGGDAREWSFAWRTALWARLGDAEAAHGQLQQLFSDRNTCPNLFGLHPPMQADGNFGITAAIAEMLMQSHEGQINLLPALPKAWPSGSVTGLRARGGVVVSLTWKDAALTEVTLTATQSQTVKVRIGTHLTELQLPAHRPITRSAQQLNPHSGV
ncbi:MAG: glycoside hydrolase family 95 protein [Tepidisphaeraceae bacterium]